MATLEMSNDLEIINPETVKGGAKGCNVKISNCGTKTTCIIRFRDTKL